MNLLLILHTLIRERHVSRSAAALDMSQPAMSRALQRLRESLGDPILVRTQSGYDLSSRARTMAPELAAILRSLEQLVAPPYFAPELDDGLIRITGLDLELGIYLPELFKRMRVLAPNMRLETVRQEDDSFPMLERDEVHFSLSGLAPLSAESHLHRRVLDEMPTVCLMAAEHPLAERTFTSAEYAQAPHGLVSITGKGPGTMDQVLAEHGLSRTVALRLSGFTSVGDFCEGSDLLFTLPLRLAERIAAGRNLVIRELPYELKRPPVCFYLYWHERYHQDPRMQWFREQFILSTRASESHHLLHKD